MPFARQWMELDKGAYAKCNKPGGEKIIKAIATHGLKLEKIAL